MKELSQKLGFIPISMYELLVDQVRNKTELGQKIYEDLKKSKLISDEYVSGILKARLEKADCKLHGFVLEGFPKTESQLKLFQSMRLEPNFVISLECSEDVAKRRIVNKLKQTGKILNPEEEKELDARYYFVLL